MTSVDSVFQDLDAIYIAINQGHNINHTYNIRIKNYLSAHPLKTVNLIAITNHIPLFQLVLQISLMLP
jgi:hypothetical protein